MYFCPKIMILKRFPWYDSPDKMIAPLGFDESAMGPGKLTSRISTDFRHGFPLLG